MATAKRAIPLVLHTLQDSVYVSLRDSLMCGEFVPGKRLTAREIAESMGTSAMPVREAFRRLIAQGALEPLSTGAPRVPTFDSSKLADVMEVRAEVEGLAIRRAATRITDEQLQEVISANEQMLAARRQRDPKVEARANEAFHFNIYRAAGSEELLRVIEYLWLRIGPCLFAMLEAERKAFERSRKPGPGAHHAAIIEALRRRKADDAVAALRSDLAAAATFFASRMNTERRGGSSARISSGSRGSAARGSLVCT